MSTRHDTPEETDRLRMQACQYLYFCTIKASKLSTCARVADLTFALIHPQLRNALVNLYFIFIFFLLFYFHIFFALIHPQLRNALVNLCVRVYGCVGMGVWVWWIVAGGVIVV